MPFPRQYVFPGSEHDLRLVLDLGQPNTANIREFVPAQIFCRNHRQRWRTPSQATDHRETPPPRLPVPYRPPSRCDSPTPFSQTFPKQGKHAPPDAMSHSPPPPRTALHTLLLSSLPLPRPRTPSTARLRTRTDPQAPAGVRDIAGRPRLAAPRMHSTSGSTTSVGSPPCHGSACHPTSLMVMALGLGLGMGLSHSTEQTHRSSDPLVPHCSSTPTS